MFYDLLEDYSATFFGIHAAYMGWCYEQWHQNENVKLLWEAAPWVLVGALSLLLPWWARTAIVVLMVIPWLFQLRQWDR